jgi:phosphoribosylaminoimidazole (AIR) synthetase
LKLIVSVKERGNIMENEGLKYDVNIDEANEAKKNMAESLATDNKRVLNKLGAFSSLYDINN